MIQIKYFIYLKNQLKLLFGFAAVLFVLMPSTVLAHGLVQDTTGKVDSILHYVPDDDPTVGTPTVFHYLLEKDFVMTGAKASLVINHKNGAQVANIPATVGVHSAAALYTFQNAGTYDITLKLIASGGHPYTFKTTEDITMPEVEKTASTAEQMWPIAGSAVLAAAVFVAALFRFKKRAQS
ncbi:MAG: hypothetical protein JWO47_374 [Candidatus Saccharibacteria bacterium]|nr:hypothetical protein [Candidatus Saccharibacteria bacterium]